MMTRLHVSKCTFSEFAQRFDSPLAWPTKHWEKISMRATIKMAATCVNYHRLICINRNNHFVIAIKYSWKEMHTIFETLMQYIDVNDIWHYWLVFKLWDLSNILAITLR